MEATYGLPDWLITTALALGGFVLFWLNRQRLGLGEVQMATRAEQLAVIDLQEKRIVLLEAEVVRLRAEVQYLSAENHDYRRRITRLESHEIGGDE
jgi:cell division protein FtsB